jgi:hypothetical protein
MINDQQHCPLERGKLTLELVDDVARLDEQIKESHRRIRTAVRASKTSLTDLFGVGPVLACSVIGYSGDVARFANRDSFAAYAGIAPSSTLREAGYSIGSRYGAIVGSTTPSIWWRSARSASPIHKVGPTSIARSPRARPSLKSCAPSSAT